MLQFRLDYMLPPLTFSTVHGILTLSNASCKLL